MNGSMAFPHKIHVKIIIKNTMCQAPRPTVNKKGEHTVVPQFSCRV